MQQQRPRTGARRHEFPASTKQDLVATARTLFTDHGYAATSLDTIVAATNVTKGALYHHFDGKQDLFKAVHRAIDDDAVERIGAAVDRESDPWAGAVAGLRAFLQVAREPEYRRVIIQEGPSVLGYADRRETERTTYDTVQQLVRATLTSGTWQVPDEMVETFSRIIFGAMNSAGAAVATSDEPDAETERVETAVGLLLAALRSLSNEHPDVDSATIT